MKKEIVQTAIGTLIKLLIQKGWPIFASAVVPIPAYLYLKGAEITSAQQYDKYSLAALSILFGLSTLFLIYSVCMYRKYGRFQEAYGVLWDKNFKMRCMHCKTLLKNSTEGPEIFFCPDPKCNNKYLLMKDDGNAITKQRATKLLRGLSSL